MTQGDSSSKGGEKRIGSKVNQVEIINSTLSFCYI